MRQGSLSGSGAPVKGLGTTWGEEGIRGRRGDLPAGGPGKEIQGRITGIQMRQTTTGLIRAGEASGEAG